MSKVRSESQNAGVEVASKIDVRHLKGLPTITQEQFEQIVAVVRTLLTLIGVLVD